MVWESYDWWSGGNNTQNLRDGRSIGNRLAREFVSCVVTNRYAHATNVAFRFTGPALLKDGRAFFFALQFATLRASCPRRCQSLNYASVLGARAGPRVRYGVPRRTGFNSESPGGDRDSLLHPSLSGSG